MQSLPYSNNEKYLSIKQIKSIRITGKTKSLEIQTNRRNLILLAYR